MPHLFCVCCILFANGRENKLCNDGFAIDITHTQKEVLRSIKNLEKSYYHKKSWDKYSQLCIAPYNVLISDKNMIKKNRYVVTKVAQAVIFFTTSGK